MSMSARKRRNRQETRRYERKRFRAAEKAVTRGDHARNERFGENWSGVTGMRGRNLPLEEFSDEALDQMETSLPGTPVTFNGEQIGVVTKAEIMDDWLAMQDEIMDDYDWTCI